MLIVAPDRNRQRELNLSVVRGTTNSQKDKNSPFLLHEDIRQDCPITQGHGPRKGAFLRSKNGKSVPQCDFKSIVETLTW